MSRAASAGGRRGFLRGSTVSLGSALVGAGRRRLLDDLLGRLPDRRRPISAEKRGEEERDGYLLETWELDRWRLLRFDVGHQQTAEGRREIVEFFHRFL